MASVQTKIEFPVKKKGISRRRTKKEETNEVENKENSPSKKALITQPEKTLTRHLSPTRPLDDVTQTPLPIVIDYSETKQLLHSNQPDFLYGRDKEEASIRDFLCLHMETPSPGSLYISGAPGTGKTALLKTILSSLSFHHEKVYINCMSHKNSSAIFSHIISSLTLPISTKSSRGRKVQKRTKKKTLEEIESLICSQPILLILDEIDNLDSKNQEVLYTIFEWPSLQGSLLVLVGISNSLDLTQRILPRLSSQLLQPVLLNFPPYTSQDINDIINNRLEKLGPQSALEPSSIFFCSRKISSLTGDLRMSLNICRRAVDLLEVRHKAGDVKTQKVNIPLMMKVINEVYGQKTKSELPQSIPLQQLVAMCALLLLGKSTRNKEVLLGKLHESYSRICNRENLSSVDLSDFIQILSSLQDRGFLSVKKTKEIRISKISLRVDEEEFGSVVQDKTFFSSIFHKGL